MENPAVRIENPAYKRPYIIKDYGSYFIGRHTAGDQSRLAVFKGDSQRTFLADLAGPDYLCSALSRDHFQLSLTPKSIIVDYFGKNGAYRKIASGEKSALVKGENYSLTEGDNHFFLGKPPQDIELLIKVGPLENLVGRRRMFWENLRELLRLYPRVS